jgi:hypothetical protein
VERRPDGLPRFLVLEPHASLRLELRVRRPPFELSLEPQNAEPGRSFVLMLGPPGGPIRQRLRLSGRTRILFEPRDRRGHLLVLVNPDAEPLVLELRGRPARIVREASRSRPRRPAPRAGRGLPPVVRVRPLPLARPAYLAAPSGSAPNAPRLRGGRPKA